MANLLSLPTELILEIFSHLGDSCWPPNPPNSWFGIMPSYPKGELFNIALVCRRLASIATPLIYREIVLYDPSLSFNAEKLFWSFKENPILRSYVRVIFFSERPFEEFGDDSELAKFFHFPNAVEVIVNHDGCDGVEHDDCLWGGNKGEYYVWTNRFPILLSSCPQLSKLVLLIEGVGDWDCQKTEILLSKLEPHASTLTELSVRYAKGMGRGRPNRSSPIWHPLTHGLCKFSAVQRIQVDWSFFLPYELLWDERLPICKPHTKVPSNIRTLEVSCSVVYALTEIIIFLFRSSSHHIRECLLGKLLRRIHPLSNHFSWCNRGGGRTLTESSHLLTKLAIC